MITPIPRQPGLFPNVLHSLTAAGLTLLAPVLFAAPPPAVRVMEGGQPRDYAVALDELALRAPRLQTIQLPGVDTPAEAQSRAAGWRAAHGVEAALVLYPSAGPRNEFTRRVVTPQVAVHLAVGTDAAALAAVVGAQGVTPVPGLRGWQVFEASSANGSLELAARLAAQPGVLAAEPQLARQHARKLVPNDPFFWQLWHLRNTGLNLGISGVDVQVTNVWNNWRGDGMVIGIVDDGVQGEHPDLAPNYSAALSTNLNVGPFDPFYDYHGTLVAGAAAARGNNAIGGAGAAYEATLASIRLISEYTSDATDAQAMLHRNDVIQVKNNSWGGQDTTPSVLEGPGPLMAAAFTAGTTEGRGGLGTIYVFSGGNGRTYGENVNDDGYANQPQVIAVGAVDDRGQQSSFSEPGACLTVCGPSGSGAEICNGGRQRIITTDLLGQDGRNWQFASCEMSDRDYTQNFSGTSAAAPLVSGVTALLLQANPLLGWRDVKEILLRSASRVSPADPEWVTNSAGIAHNPKFGGGLVSAERAVQLATNWINLGSQQKISAIQSNLAMPVPDNVSAGITQQFVVTEGNFRVEQACLTLWLPHERYGDLEITLTSPGGISSRLATAHSTAGAGYYGWTFTSVRNWGESPLGTWTLKIADVNPGKTGTLDSAQLDLLGSVPTRFWMTTAAALPVLHATYNAPGADCRQFVFEASTNLSDWTGIATNTMCNGGTMEFTDSDAVNYPSRFYRLRW
jgi:subtilisin-like proprotein convertase family protein/subtilisin family serine protease